MKTICSTQTSPLHKEKKASQHNFHQQQKRKELLRVLLALILSMRMLSLSADNPEDGKVYRLVSKMYPTLAATEDISTSGVVTRTKGGDNAFEQMWRFDAKDNGFTLTNVLTGNAISNYGGANNQYWTNSSDAAHTFQLVSPTADYWNVRHATGKGGLHAAWTGKVVYWYDNAADATQWKLEEITNISEDELSLKQLVYKNYTDLTSNESVYNEKLKEFFTDESCSELRPAFASMNDETLLEAMAALPETFRQIALKVKNDSWTHREREFRIRSYKAYSDPEYWYQVLLTNRWGRINNPTGIYGNTGDIILVFVGDNIPQGATLQLEFIQGTSVQGSAVDLHKGLNVLTVAVDEAMFYIQYIGTTTPESSTLITDYPPLRIHIENGIVNGFWNMAEHSDDDWMDILAHATASTIDVKGDKVMYHMHTSVMRQNCPNSIHNAIDWWEDMLNWQHDIMGIEEFVPKKCNNMACAITLDDNSTYMAATWYRTQYHVSVAYKILDFNTVITDPDYCFGPAHENGHMNQGAINVVGCTESSNGILENLIVWKIGKYLTRGPVNNTMWNEYAQNIPWPNRSNDNLLRLHWQLYLYFHECGIDTTFWPRVFKAMRSTPLPIRWGGKKEVTAAEDMLLFARHCCDIAQMNLSDFFRVYGFLVPHEKMETRESGNYLTTPKKDIDDFLAYASRYPKAPPIEFIDDRIRPVPRTDGGSGSRLTYDYGVGQCGDVGHYTDFLTTSVHAEGYIYSRSGNTITIKDGTGAVGFRLYNKADGQLAYLSNNLKFTLPASCQDIRLRIVAVSADGTETDIPSTAQAGTEAEQFAALKNSLSNAKSLLDLGDATEKTVGYYFTFALNDLQTLYNAALAAYNAKDQQTHTYGQWAMLLDEASYAVTTNGEARIPVFSENTYALFLTVYKSYSLNYLSSGPKGSIADPATEPLKGWQFVPSEKEGSFHIRNAGNGLFITEMESGKRVKLQSDDASDALTFSLQYATKGIIYIVDANTGLFLSYNGNKEAIGSTSAMGWRIVTIDDKHAEALAARSQTFLRIAGYMSDELASDNLFIRSEAFDAQKQQFLHAFQTIQEMIGVGATGRLDLRLAELWDTMESLSPLYVCPNLHTRLGADDQEAKGNWYFYLQNLKTGAYAYVNTDGGRYDGCLRMGSLTDPDDLRFLFRIEKDDDGRFFLRNAYSEHLCGLWNSYIDFGGSREPVSFRIELDENLGGLSISNDNGSWTMQISTSTNAYAQFRTNATPWKFRTGMYIENTGIAPVHYTGAPRRNVFDLQGHPSSIQQKGILIINGKKVLVK